MILHAIEGIANILLTVTVVAVVVAAYVARLAVVTARFNIVNNKILIMIVYLLLQLKNCTSLTANIVALPYLNISNFLVLKLTLMLTLLRPAGSAPGGTEATSTSG